MKKIAYIPLVAAFLFLAACSSSPKTGGSTADSGSVGSSGAADTSVKSNTTGTGAQTTAGSDTSKNGKGVDAPVADTGKKQKP